MTIPALEITVEAIYAIGIATYLAIAVFFGGLLTRINEQKLRTGTWDGSGYVFVSLCWPIMLVLWSIAGVLALLCHCLDVYF